MATIQLSVTLAALRTAGAMYRFNQVVRMVQGVPFSAKDAARSRYIRFEHDEPILLADIARHCGYDTARWALGGIDESASDARLFAVWCVRDIETLLVDERSKAALREAERSALGLIDADALRRAQHQAQIAAEEQLKTEPANKASFSAAYTAASVAHDDPWQAAFNAPAAATWTAYHASPKHSADSVWAESCAKQLELFLTMCEGTAPWQQR